jgi:hypothetical protein
MESIIAENAHGKLAIFDRIKDQIRVECREVNHRPEDADN